MCTICICILIKKKKKTTAVLLSESQEVIIPRFRHFVYLIPGFALVRSTTQIAQF